VSPVAAPAHDAVEAVRWLQAGCPEHVCIGGDHPVRERIRLRAAAHLGFPAGEIESARADPHGRWTVELTLPALLGPGSPLPAYLLERLMREPAGLPRALVELIDHRLLSLILRATGGSVLTSPRRWRERLARAAGLDGRDDLLRYAALLAQPRCADDLERLLTDRCAPHLVGLVERAPGTAVAPVSERTRLGLANAALGADLFIGEQVDACAFTVVVRVGPLPCVASGVLLPRGALRAALADLVRRWDPEVAWELEVVVSGTTLPVASLGGQAPLSSGVRLDGQPALGYVLRSLLVAERDVDLIDLAGVQEPHLAAAADDAQLP
jgi:type VI secretion system ImpH/TssG family protein